ncbi:unnamed protein product [Laminaria digitata]
MYTWSRVTESTAIATHKRAKVQAKQPRERRGQRRATTATTTTAAKNLTGLRLLLLLLVLLLLLLSPLPTTNERRMRREMRGNEIQHFVVCICVSLCIVAPAGRVYLLAFV